MSAERIDVLEVTTEQFERIESLWAICSYGNGRKAIGEWGRTFNEGVAEVLGYTPPESYALAVQP